MRCFPLFATALSVIVAVSFADSAADADNTGAATQSVTLSSEDFQALIAAAKSLPNSSQSVPLQRAVDEWSMIAYAAERVPASDPPAIKATIFFEPSEDFGPMIVCFSSGDEVDWTQCEDATVNRKDGCT